MQTMYSTDKYSRFYIVYIFYILPLLLLLPAVCCLVHPQPKKQ